MSAPLGGDALAQVIASSLPETYLELAGLAMIVYEYLITFNHEIMLFWMRKQTGATVLFLMVRYLALLTYLLGAATFASMSDKSCGIVVTVQAVVGLVQYAVWAAVSSLRVLALSKMNWPLASAVFILALGPLVVNAWILSLGISGINLPVIGCAAESSLRSHTAVFSKIAKATLQFTMWTLLTRNPIFAATVASRSSVIVADSIVVLVTWRSQLTVLGIAAQWSISSLGSILIVNGTIYFLTFATLNTLQLILTLISIISSLEPFSVVTVLIDPLEAILTCRFLIALQSANQKALGQHPNGTLSTGSGDENGDTLQFASRVLGSIGASLPGESAGSALDDGQEPDFEREPAVEEKVAENDEGQTGQAPPDVHSEIQTVSC